MANPEHVAKLKEGVGAWNEWRRTTDEQPDLSGADLNGTDLSGADLRHATLDGTYLFGVNFSHASLTNATLRGAFLISTRFHLIDLVGADLTDAYVGYTVFTNVDLSKTRGLEAMHHMGPSTIGIDTLVLSGGLPDSFLRGCGVPEEFIAYANSLVGKPIEYYSTFLSYSSKDDPFAQRLYDTLQGRGIRTWFASEDLKIGDHFRARIDESIRLHDKLILILSASSVASEWVETEVEAALDRERREKRDVLFPIAIDDEGFDAQAPWAADIRRKRHIGDFRRWKEHDEFQRAFERLVRDLKKGTQIVMR